MNVLTARQKFILNRLIDNESASIEELSLQMNVSSRTTRREISAINSCLKQYKLRISEVGGRLNLNGDRKSIDKIHEQFSGIPYLWMLTPEQRQTFMTAQLLLSNEPLKSAYFSYQFNVVEGTISLYLDKVEKWLKVRDLNLIRKRGRGLVIEGTEWNKRNAFVELLYSYESMNDLLNFLYKESNKYSVSAFFRLSFGDEIINLSRKLLKKLEKCNFLNIGDEAYFGAFIHILLSVKRTQSGSSIKLPNYLVSDILSSKEFSFIKDIDRIFKENGVALSDSELAYISIHLNGGKYIYKDDRKFEAIGIDMEDAVREVVYEASKKLNIKINLDHQLMVGLIQHFSPAFYRLTMGLQLRNPIIDQIKEYYIGLFEAVDYACKIVFSKYNLSIPYSEVGYITMHIGAAIERQNLLNRELRVLIICSNGISTANILHSKLKRIFPEFEIIDICSLKDMNKKIEDGYDLLLSTIKVNNNSDKNIITVSPFLPDKDIEKIRDKIILNKSRWPGPDIIRNTNMKGMEGSEKDFEIADNMLKNFQLKNLDVENLQSVIKKVVNDIYELNKIDDKEKVEYLINEREEQGNVVIPGSHVALIHIRAEEIEIPFVGAYRLQNPIEMKSIGFSFEDVDTFFVMFARKNESNYILELLGKISISLVEGKRFIRLLRLGNIKDIRTELVHILNREEY